METKRSFNWKDKYIDEPWARLIKINRVSPKSIKSEMKKGSYNGYHRNTKEYKNCIWTIYTNDMANKEEMGKFTEIQDWARKK